MKFNDSEIKKNIGKMEANMRNSLKELGKETAQELEQDAKANFVWTPRTKKAHTSLTGDYELTTTKLKISLAHGVEYGQYLEYAHERKYAIIKPTIDKNAPKVIDKLEGILDV